MDVTPHLMGMETFLFPAVGGTPISWDITTVTITIVPSYEVELNPHVVSLLWTLLFFDCQSLRLDIFDNTIYVVFRVLETVKPLFLVYRSRCFFYFLHEHTQLVPIGSQLF